MVVRALFKRELEKAVIFSYDLVGNREFMTPYTPKGYNELTDHYNKIFNHKFDIILGCFKGAKLEGVLCLMVAGKTKTLICVGGPYIANDFGIVFNKFNAFIKANYAGFKVIYSFSIYNSLHNSFMSLNGNEPYMIENVLSINDSNATKKKTDFIMLDENTFDLFSVYHDDTNKFWTSEKIIKNLNKFNVYLKFTEANKFIGYIVIDSSKDIKEIIDIFILEEYKDSKYAKEMIEGLLYYELTNKIIVKLLIEDEYYINLFINNNFSTIDKINYYKVEV